MGKYFVPNFLNNLWCLGNKLYVCILHHKYKTYSKKTGKTSEGEKKPSVFPTSSW